MVAGQDAGPSRCAGPTPRSPRASQEIIPLTPRTAQCRRRNGRWDSWNFSPVCQRPDWDPVDKAADASNDLSPRQRKLAFLLNLGQQRFGFGQFVGLKFRADDLRKVEDVEFHVLDGGGGLGAGARFDNFAGHLQVPRPLPRSRERAAARAKRRHRDVPAQDSGRWRAPARRERAGAKALVKIDGVVAENWRMAFWISCSLIFLRSEIGAEGLMPLVQRATSPGPPPRRKIFPCRRRWRAAGLEGGHEVEISGDDVKLGVVDRLGKPIVVAGLLLGPSFP